MSHRPAFVFVHGAWHNGATWTDFAELERRGHASIAKDQAGLPLIAAADKDFGNVTIVHDLADGHSPFYSNPADLAEVLATIAG